MKKYIVGVLFACLLCVFSVTVFASENELNFQAEYEALYGKAPVVTDFPDRADFDTAYNLWISGLMAYIDRRTIEEEQKKVAVEAARIAAEKEAEEKAAEADTPVIPPKADESAGSNNVAPSNPIDTSQDTGAVDKYPVGSYIDSAGNVYSPDGELLSPGTTPASEPAVETSSDSQMVEDLNPVAVTSPTWYVEDLRSTDISEDVLTGLKALVTSIFGEYTPVTTTTVISETVGTDTHQYLVETVASGAAGVDYEWIAGVVLFAIMLYCLMRLLGGVLK